MTTSKISNHVCGHASLPRCYVTTDKKCDYRSDHCEVKLGWTKQMPDLLFIVHVI